MARLVGFIGNRPDLGARVIELEAPSRAVRRAPGVTPGWGVGFYQGGEILLKRRPIFAYEIDGVRHDTGNKRGVLKAMVYFALKRPELAEPFKAYLAKMGTPVGK